MAQQEALEGVLESVGWVSEIIVNERTGFVVDGHLRVALALRKDAGSVPVTYVDLTEEEEQEILATLDPLAAMAGTDAEKLEELLELVNFDKQPVNDMLAALQQQELRVITGQFERPDYSGVVEQFEANTGQAVGNANWFYVEFYEDQERFDELAALLEKHLSGQSSHELDPDSFYKIVKAYVDAEDA